MPVFYRDVMYKEAEYGEDVAHLKLFDGREWKWFQVKLLHTDMEYLRKKWSGKKGVRPNVGKETSYIFPSIFVHRGSKLIENSRKRAGDMQC